MKTNFILASTLALILSNPASALFADCNDAVKALKPLGEACMKIADANQRKSCLDQAPSKAGVPQDLMQKCGNGGPLDQLKNELMSKEKSLYPSQSTGFGSNNGKGPDTLSQGQKMPAEMLGNSQNNNQGNMQGNTQGGNNNGQTANVSKKECDAVLAKLKPASDKCLQVSDFQKRAACFESLPKSIGVDQALLDGCMKSGFLDSLKKQIMDQEKKKYPKQASALDNKGGNNNQGTSSQGGSNTQGSSSQGGNNSQVNMQGNNQGGSSIGGSQATAWPVAQCQSLVSKLRSYAEGCLKEKDQAKRCACVKGADSQFPEGFFKGGCSSTLDPIGNEFKSKERAAYPTQQGCFNN